ncbi:Uncharacterized protein HZ326_6956 [Fusarium oxysporum f. sp. albedinis]|nr:Uncharacterized protein HZ326_6956 [Fusarium oxysporum f. sp. albedinis]
MKDKRALSLFPSPFISFLIDLPKFRFLRRCRFGSGIFLKAIVTVLIKVLHMARQKPQPTSARDRDGYYMTNCGMFLGQLNT